MIETGKQMDRRTETAEETTHGPQPRSLAPIPWPGLPGWAAALLLTCSSAFAAPAESQIRAAIEKSIPLLEAGTKGSIEKRARCFTCHNQAHPVIALTTARARGFKIDEANLRRQVKFTADFLTKGRANYLKGRGQGGQAETAGWALRTLEHGKWPADETTAAVAHYLLQYQGHMPNWKPPSHRPPSTKSPFTTTHGALRGLQNFGTDKQTENIAGRRAKVREWLFKTPAEDNEDRISKLRLLSLIDEPEAAAKAAQELLQTQRPDGGWSQLPKMNSDAYATGTALTALHETGHLPVAARAYQRGLQFLLKSQLADGSWLVESRSKPFQTHYESGYPHGTNQFISISAGSWATTALALSLPKNEP